MSEDLNKSSCSVVPQVTSSLTPTQSICCSDLNTQYWLTSTLQCTHVSILSVCLTNNTSISPETNQPQVQFPTIQHLQPHTALPVSDRNQTSIIVRLDNGTNVLTKCKQIKQLWHGGHPNIIRGKKVTYLVWFQFDPWGHGTAAMKNQHLLGCRPARSTLQQQNGSKMKINGWTGRRTGEWTMGQIQEKPCWTYRWSRLIKWTN